MSLPIDADYSKQYLLPPAVEDWVPPEHPVRFIREFVDALDLTTLEAERKKESSQPPATGRPPYSAKLLLKLWLYAYMSGIRSSRKLERACRELLPMVWLAGGHQPDHNTLARFWQSNRVDVRKVYGKSIRLAINVGLIDFALQAMDGTKIHAQGGTRKAVSKEQLKRRLERVDAEIRQVEEQIAAADTLESTRQEEGLSKQLQDRKALREAIVANLQKIEDLPGKRNPSEPEARLMKGCGLGYNAQAVVDSKANLIVAADVASETNDEKQLIPMLELVEKELGRVADETIADGGYNTAAAVADAEERNYPIILSPSPHDAESHPDNPYHVSNFRYDEEKDVVVCPEKQELTLRFERLRKPDNLIVRRYATTACKQCPVRSSCTKDPAGRRIDISAFQPAIERQRLKRAGPRAKELLKKRMALAERPFAVIKWLMGFTRFRFKGLELARTEWIFVCLVHNLRQLMSINGRKTATAV